MSDSAVGAIGAAGEGGDVRPALSLSSGDRASLAEVERLVASGESSIGELIARLSEPSWAVRRAVVAGLAHLGDLALGPLCEVLQAERSDEARLAAAVDALASSRGDVDGALLRLLEDAALLPAPVLCDLAQILGRRKSVGAASALAALVAHVDDNVAVLAIEALGRIGGAGVIEPLLAAIASGNFFRVFPAIAVLGRSGDRRAISPLLALLDDPLYAIEVLQALGRAGEAAALVGVLRRPEDLYVRAAAVALVELHDRQIERVGVDQVTPAAVHDAALSADLIPRYRRVMAAADPAEQRALCQLLGWVGGGAAADALLVLLAEAPPLAEAAAAALSSLGRDADPQIRRAIREGDAARRLVLIPLLHARAAALPELRLCLSDPDPAVRAASASVLGAAGDLSVVRELFDLLGDRDPGVVHAALGAIQSLGGAETEELALSAARSSDLRLRRAALWIVSYFGYRSGIDLLLEALHGTDERIRDVAIQGLPFVDDPRSIEALLGAAAHPSPPARAAAVRALGHLDAAGEDEPRVIACLLRGLADPDAWVRYYACQALGRLHAVSAVEAIVARMDDEAGQVQVAAVEALARLGTDRAVGALRRAAAAVDPDLARAALLGLASQKRRDALPLIEQAVRSPDRATRLMALEAASALDAPEVLGILRAVAADDDEEVRRAAIGHLAARPGAAATLALIELLAEPRARESVASALINPRADRLAALLSALETAEEEIAPILVRVLGQSAEPVAALSLALTSSGLSGRRAAAAALAALAAPRSRSVLERALAEDTDPEVRRIAALALGR
jgi:HEAT repeat protein